MALMAHPLAGMAIESAKVLPKGVRNIDIRTVNTNIDSKTDRAGEAKPLAQPLAQDLTFAKIAKGENTTKAKQLRAFLADNGFSESDAVGSFTADLKGHIGVAATIASYGLSDKLTLAIAAPYYRASTSIAVGFKTTDTGQAFLDSLAKPDNNQQAAAVEAGSKINDAVGRLNDKLQDNGYRALEDWSGQGFGDLTLAGKYQLYKRDDFAVASTAGVVAPTGRVDDPDILNDVGFGDGQWDVFAQGAVDEPLWFDLSLNQFAKYTVQLPGVKSVRQATEEESIEVGKQEVPFKLGDKVDAGLSLSWSPPHGTVMGVGYNYFRKFGDIYKELPEDAKKKIEDATDQEAHNSEVMLGYSTLPLFQRGAFPVPLDLKLTYIRQLASRNLPVTELAQLDFNLFF